MQIVDTTKVNVVIMSVCDLRPREHTRAMPVVPESRILAHTRAKSCFRISRSISKCPHFLRVLFYPVRDLNLDNRLPPSQLCGSVKPVYSR